MAHSRSPRKVAESFCACPSRVAGRLVVEMTPDEAKELGAAIDGCEGLS